VVVAAGLTKVDPATTLWALIGHGLEVSSFILPMSYLEGIWREAGTGVEEEADEILPKRPAHTTF